MPKFVRYNQEGNELVINVRKAVIGVNIIEVILKDQLGFNETYLLKMSLKSPDDQIEFDLTNVD